MKSSPISLIATTLPAVARSLSSAMTASPTGPTRSIGCIPTPENRPGRSFDSESWTDRREDSSVVPALTIMPTPVRAALSTISATSESGKQSR